MSDSGRTLRDYCQSCQCFYDDDDWRFHQHAAKMSTSICNYCRLRQIKDAAKKLGLKVTTKRNAMRSGIDVFVDGKWNAWFMALTNECACDE